MTSEEARRIIHPETTLEALAGFKGMEAKLEAANEASIVACEALEKADKYAWHKCEKISDLPAANLTVHVREEDAIGNVRYAHNTVCMLVDGTKAWAITGDYPVWKITHWRYIEPVEGDK